MPVTGTVQLHGTPAAGCDLAPVVAGRLRAPAGPAEPAETELVVGLVNADILDE